MASPRAERSAHQRVWPDGDRRSTARSTKLLQSDPDEARRPDRPADFEHAGLRSGLRPAACSCGCDGRALHHGSGAGARLSGPCGADRRAVRGGSAWRGGEPDVPDRRPGALAAGRGAGVPGPRGRAGEAARLPDRAWRDRGGAGAACRDRAGGGDRARGYVRQQAAGGLCGGGRASRYPMRLRCGRTWRRACRTTWCRRPVWCWSVCR